MEFPTPVEGATSHEWSVKTLATQKHYQTFGNAGSSRLLVRFLDSPDAPASRCDNSQPPSRWLNCPKKDNLAQHGGDGISGSWQGDFQHIQYPVVVGSGSFNLGNLEKQFRVYTALRNFEASRPQDLENKRHCHGKMEMPWEEVASPHKAVIQDFNYSTSFCCHCTATNRSTSALQEGLQWQLVILNLPRLIYSQDVFPL